MLMSKRSVERGLDGGFYFGSGESLGGRRDAVKIVIGRVTFSTSQLDGEDFLTLGCIGQVYKEQFVETSFTDQLGRQHSDVVAGGGYEDRGFALLHPG